MLGLPHRLFAWLMRASAERLPLYGVAPLLVMDMIEGTLFSIFSTSSLLAPCYVE